MATSQQPQGRGQIRGVPSPPCPMISCQASRYRPEAEHRDLRGPFPHQERGLRLARPQKTKDDSGALSKVSATSVSSEVWGPHARARLSLGNFLLYAHIIPSQGRRGREFPILNMSGTPVFIFRSGQRGGLPCACILGHKGTSLVGSQLMSVAPLSFHPSKKASF